jgi:hypothetical protein
LHIKRVAVGWNERLNRLYFMAEVSDNIHLFEKPADHIDSLDTYNSRRTGAFVHGSDIFEIVIDADHGRERVVNLSENEEEEMRLRSAFAQNYHLYMQPLTVPIGTGCEDGRRGPMIRLIRMWAGVSTGSTVRMAR